MNNSQNFLAARSGLCTSSISLLDMLRPTHEQFTAHPTAAQPGQACPHAAAKPPAACLHKSPPPAHEGSTYLTQSTCSHMLAGTMHSIPGLNTLENISHASCCFACLHVTAGTDSKEYATPVHTHSTGTAVQVPCCMHACMHAPPPRWPGTGPASGGRARPCSPAPCSPPRPAAPCPPAQARPLFCHGCCA